MQLKQQNFQLQILAGENWQEEVQQNIEKNMDAIDIYQSQMVNLWFYGDYYNAGKAFGTIEAYVFGLLWTSCKVSIYPDFWLSI